MYYDIPHRCVSRRFVAGTFVGCAVTLLSLVAALHAIPTAPSIREMQCVIREPRPAVDYGSTIRVSLEPTRLVGVCHVGR